MAAENTKHTGSGSDADSAYHTMPDTELAHLDSARTSGPVTSRSILKSRRQSIPGSDLSLFKPGPRHRGLVRYFEKISPAIEAKLEHEVIQFGRQPWHHLSLQIGAVGTTEQDAELHILVIFASYLEDLMIRILAERELKNLLAVPGSTETLAYLPIPVPLKSTSAYLDIDVCSQTSYPSIHGTYCGAPIVVTASNEEHNRTLFHQATFGGVLKATYGQGAIHYYGMSAGHILPRDLQARSEDDPATLDASNVTGWISDDNVLGRPLNSTQLPGITANRASPAYDWSLFDVAEARPNRALHRTSNSPANNAHTIELAEKPHFHDDEPCPVLMLGAVTGPRYGELATVPARIWLAYTETFVSAYILETEGDTGKV